MIHRYRPAAIVAIMSVVMALAVSGLAFSLMAGGRAQAEPAYPPVTPTVTVTVPVPGPTVTITITPRPETPPGQIVSCAVKTVKSASRIKVNMGPNLPGTKNYQFRLDVLRGGEWFRYMSSFKTQGKGETRTVNVPKGTYRVKCYGSYGYQDAPVSKTLKLKR